LEAAWRDWRTGEPPPRWEDFLPRSEESCDPERAFYLVQADIEFRARAGLPALLAEPYFRHPRLQQSDARLDEARQVELIRWEYQQRWKNGGRPRRADYLAAFPHHAVALADLQPRWNCPRCHERGIVEGDEAVPVFVCPHCGTDYAPTKVFPVREPAPGTAAGVELDGLDLREYQLLDALGAGGMGEVYRGLDPGLGRDLAIKVMRPRFRGHPEAEARFVREARVTGALEHPGIVPVHNLGRLPDGRLYFTMKLVRGRTLEHLLAQSAAARAQHLPELLGVFEKVCQAVAYAHSKGVIHRDLKPANIMVGAFGEVQVMDWGLAGIGASEEAEAASEPGPCSVLSATPSPLATAHGAVLGTLSYMAPEQARGEVKQVDERADVFALGGILCAILTGRPPYALPSGDELLLQAQRGDLAEALGRLDGCGGDAELLSLCKECLAVERERRPRDAGAVAERFAAYQAGVRERLRQAELDRAHAQVRAIEERKRRRLAVALAAAVALLVLGGGALAWWQQQRQAAVDQTVLQALAEARLLHERARANPLDAGDYRQALAAAVKARDVARTGSASAAVRRQAEELSAQLEREEQAVAKDRRLLTRFLETRRLAFGRNQREVGLIVGMPADEQFASAFRAWGLDVDTTPLGQARARLSARPRAVLTEIVAALEQWAEGRQRLNRPRQAWQRLIDLAAALDEDPDATRRALREIVSRQRLPREKALGVLGASLRPVPVPVPIALGPDSTRLRRLAEQTDPARATPLGVMTLTRALRLAGDAAGAEQLLRAAVLARPREVVLHMELGHLLVEQKRMPEAVEAYTAARALRPELGEALAVTLSLSGRRAEALALAERLTAENPESPNLHFMHGRLLSARGNWQKAAAAYRRAIALERQFVQAHVNLSFVLSRSRDVEGAITAARQAIALDPKFAMAHHNLSNVLHDKGDLKGALQAARHAVRLDPTLPQAQYNLGSLYMLSHDPERALPALERAIALDPTYAYAHYNRGMVLYARGDREGAITAFRRALALDRTIARAQFNLGLALHNKGDMPGAVAALREAVALTPENAEAHEALGRSLFKLGRYAEGRAAGQRALALLPLGHPFRRVVTQLLRDCEQGLTPESK
jgi:serine/threonine-protein kinase